MKQFHCHCGHPVYFESTSCVACGTALGFDPVTLRMRSLTGDDTRFRYCANGIDHAVCNWLLPLDDNHPLCFGCRFNRTIPNLEKPINLTRWAKLELGKKRLIFTLLSLRLPLTNGFDDPRNGLLLDFIEDSRSDPERFPESFVHTGYLGGLITINALEADDAVREAMRVEMGESYRTVLGHLRHESGHYYWMLFNARAAEKAEFSALFGDLDEDYGTALETYHANGPRPDWADRHISAYASAHPIEDWAESWGHYLQIYDVLETAVAHGVIDEAVSTDFRRSISTWRGLSIALNELNRSIGIGDAYPFVVNSTVEEKLIFIDSVIRRLQKPRPATAAH